MALKDNEINLQEGLQKFLGADGDEVTWNKIKKALLGGTTPYQIKTPRPFNGGGYDPSLLAFGGIDLEARVLPASSALSPQNPAAGFSNGFSYLTLPANVDTHLYFTIELEEWWLPSSLGIYMEWANLHTTTGDVRWEFEFKECDIGTETLAQSDSTQLRSMTIGGVLANGGTTTSFVFDQSSGFPVTMTPGPFASFYSLRISRMGASVLDTLEGSVGFIATNYTRGL